MTSKKWFHICDIYSAVTGNPGCPLFLHECPDGRPAESRPDFYAGMQDILDYMAPRQPDDNLGSCAQHIEARKLLMDKFDFLSEINFPTYSAHMKPEDMQRAIIDWQDEIAEKYIKNGSPWYQVGTVEDERLEKKMRNCVIEQVKDVTFNGEVLPHFTQLITTKSFGAFKMELN